MVAIKRRPEQLVSQQGRKTSALERGRRMRASHGATERVAKEPTRFEDDWLLSDDHPSQIEEFELPGFLGGD